MVNRKYLAAIVSTRTWDDLARRLGEDDTVELLSPCMNVPELLRSPSFELLDIVFVDAEEFDFDGAGAGAFSSGFDPYLVFIADRLQPETMRAAMQSGGRDFLARPIESADLTSVLRRAADHRKTRKVVASPPVEESPDPHPNRILTFFSTKGGAGKSTLAANFALALAAVSKRKVCLVDLALQFGDLALIMNLKPRATIGNLADTSVEHLGEEIANYLTPVNNSVSLLAAPARPEDAERIRPAHVTEILKLLAARFDYVVVDTAASFSDVSLAALDVSTDVFLIATPIILSVKNLKSALNVMEASLHYSPEKLRIVLNRSDSESGIVKKDVERIAGREIAYAVPSDGNVVVPCINRGTPPVTVNPGSKFSRAVVEMARQEAGLTAGAEKKNGKFSIFKHFKRFRRPDAVAAS